MSDWTYWHVPGRGSGLRKWHALSEGGANVRPFLHAVCGQSTFDVSQQRYDRLPPTAHLCGNCARIIAAQTDIEDTSYGVTVAPV